MRIFFFRHARPLISQSLTLTFNAYIRWSKCYNLVPVSYESCKAISVKFSAISNTKCFTSSLSRTFDTAQHIGLSDIHSLKLFDEIDLPAFCIPFIRLTPRNWGRLFRVFYEVLPSVIFHQNIVKRVDEAVVFLEEQADLHSDIIIVGHGLFNRSVQRELLKRGWLTKDGYTRKYLSCCLYFKD